MAKLYGLALRGNVAAAGIFLDRVLGPVRSALVPPGVAGAHLAPNPAGLSRSPSEEVPEKPPEGPRTMLSVAEVADELGLSEATVYGLGRKGRISICRIGRRVLVRAADLERFVRENSTCP